MIVMLCVDDKYGMMFNCRRQSQDRVLRERMQKLTGGKPLWMNAYSKKQFEDSSNICVSEEYLEHAETGEYCFVEDQDITPYAARIEKIILFRWNRTYPADAYFNFELLSSGWILKETEEFEGSSVCFDAVFVQLRLRIRFSGRFSSWQSSFWRRVIKW